MGGWCVNIATAAAWQVLCCMHLPLLLHGARSRAATAFRTVRSPAAGHRAVVSLRAGDGVLCRQHLEMSPGMTLHPEEAQKQKSWTTTATGSEPT